MNRFSPLIMSHPSCLIPPRGTASGLMLVVACISLVLLACEKKDGSIIDYRGTSPVILSASLSQASVNTDTISGATATIAFIAWARVVHPAGPSQISEVTFRFADENSETLLASGLLNDNGVTPDVRLGDSVYSARVAFSIPKVLVGKFYCNISAIDPQGAVSSTWMLPFTIGRFNRPPSLSNPVVPDSIVLANQRQQIKLKVTASDPDGNADITKVYFNSYKPDGSPSSGNPFLLYDDGSASIIFQPDIRSGDDVAGDGIYTLTVTIDPANALGVYRFEFQAMDRSNAVSNKIVRTLKVVQ